MFGGVPHSHFWPGAASALAAALLFGASTPIAKKLLGEIDPWMLAGLLYLGSGLGLGAVRLGRRLLGIASTEAPLGRRDWGWLLCAIAAGGIAGPVLLMYGLAQTPASSASLLLNLEGVLTALIAWFAFGEHFDRRIALGMAAIAAGGGVLAWPSEGVHYSAASWAIPAACLAWAVDNNLTRKVAAGDPLAVAMIKGSVAGVVNLGLALGMGASMPAPGAAVVAGAVGLVGYGVSLMLFVRALRHIGTGRTGAYFSVSPFLGALLSVLVLGEPVTVPLGVSAALIAVGVGLHLTERHEHEHVHEAVEHEHQHTHDAHHQHAHPPGTEAHEHSHPHTHEVVRHSHPHYPDIHHRHGH
jgi:drug/metabolite transporter (DMT)-like permease